MPQSRSKTQGQPRPDVPTTPEPGAVRHIQSQPALKGLFQDFRGIDLLAVDTEAASFHRYHDRIYLLQLSSREHTAVVDPLALDDLGQLGKVLATPKVEIVFHDADYDLRLLDKDYGFRARRVFDTRIAAQLLREPGIGLAALLAKYFGVTLNKKFQRADWSARPLSDEMLEYAATDTWYLPSLRDILREQLIVRGRLAWAEEEFKSLEQVRWTPREEEGLEYLRLKGAKSLPPRQLAILRELYRWRENNAKRRDRAPFRVLNNQPLLTLAKSPPKDLDALARVSGLGPETVRRMGGQIMAAIARGQRVKEENLPQIKRGPKRKQDPEVAARLERLKVARNAIAGRLDLDPGVACPNGTLESIAREVPETVDELRAVPLVRRWQADTFGKELLQAGGSSRSRPRDGKR